MPNPKEIKSGKLFVKEVFKMWFRIPDYQRPYVWGNDQLSDLLEDISYASRHAADNEYFFGSIVFQERQPVPGGRTHLENDLLDGQQRLTTLFLLMAVARDITQDINLKHTCEAFIFQQGNPYENIPEIIRIQFKIRREVEEFIDQYVKKESGTLQKKKLCEFREKSNDPSIRNMANAIIKFNEHFTGDPAVKLEDFCKFLLNKVLLIYVSSEELEDAFRLFTILNDRGVKLRNSDILKAQNLKALIKESDRETWAKYWEELEGELDEDFDRFMSWIRTMVVKEKARLSLLKEFDEVIYEPKERDKITGLPKKALLKRGDETFKLIKSYHQHYNQLLSKDNYDFSSSYHFDNLITIMNLGMPSNDWIPVLLFYYNRFKEENIVQFLKKLDNKFSGDWIAGYTPTERIESMNRIMKEIEQQTDTNALLKHDCLQVDIDNLFRNLEGNVYGKQYVRYILLKLDYYFWDHDSCKLGGYENITIEHLLPQNPSEDSQWCIDFDESQREMLCNTLGNLILLGRRKNSALGRLDYEDKKEKYFKDKINMFAMSLRLITQNEKWTPIDLQDNQRYILQILRSIYTVGDRVAV